MSFDEKVLAVKASFKRLYGRFLYLDTIIGKPEVSYLDTVPHFKSERTDGIVTLSMVKDNIKKDEYMLIKLPGIILRFNYGDMSAHKNGFTSIFIKKDPDYVGEDSASIMEILLELESYISEAIKLITIRVNKIIYGDFKTGDFPIIREQINVFDKSKVGSIEITGLPIRQEDIIKISEFVNVSEFVTKSCSFEPKCFLGNLKMRSFADFRSTIPNFDIFNNSSFEYMSFHNTVFKEKNVSRALTINAKNFNISEVELDYTSLLLSTSFNNAQKVILDGKSLSPFGATLLAGFINCVKLEANAYVDNYNFLYNLPYLEEFWGWLIPTSKVSLTQAKKIAEKGIKNAMERDPNRTGFTDYLSFINLELELKKSRKYKNFVFSPVAISKWLGVITNSSEEVKKRLEEIRLMPYKKRKLIGSENRVEFLQTDLSDYYLDLGIESAADKALEYASKYVSPIIGTDGKPLLTERYGGVGENYIPILGADGKPFILEYRKAKEKKIEGHYEQCIIKATDNTDLVFDFYYNHLPMNNQKLSCLEDRMELLMGSYGDMSLLKLISERKAQTLESERLSEVETDKICSNLWLLNSVDNCLESSRYKTHHIYLHVYYRYTKDFKSIEKAFENVVKNRKLNDKEKEELKVELLSLLDLWKQMDENNQKHISFEHILGKFLSGKPELKRAINDAESINTKDMFLDDIEDFIALYALDNTEKHILKNYILYLQEIRIKEIDDEIENLSIYEEILSNEYGVNAIYSTMQYENMEEVKKSFEQGQLDQADYDLLLEYDKVWCRLNALRHIQTAASCARTLAYYDLIPEIDGLSIEKVAEIKEKLSITSESIDIFDRLIDYLVLELTGAYPKWILLEIEKTSGVPPVIKTQLNRRYIPEETIHVRGYSILKKADNSGNPIDNLSF